MKKKKKINACFQIRILNFDKKIKYMKKMFKKLLFSEFLS